MIDVRTCTLGVASRRLAPARTCARVRTREVIRQAAHATLCNSPSCNGLHARFWIAAPLSMRYPIAATSKKARTNRLRKAKRKNDLRACTYPPIVDSLSDVSGWRVTA